MNWIVADWRTLMPTPWVQIVITFVAIFCGAVVGSEREKRDKPAGLRTLILVCVGSACFTMISYAFGTTTGDTGRVAAQIVTGIGFLGAGVILHGRSAVIGITTAATIWATSAMGMVIGTGHVAAGVGLSVVLRLILSGISLWELKFSGEWQTRRFDLLLDPNHGKGLARLEKIFHDFYGIHPYESVAEEPDGNLRIILKLHLSRRQRVEFLNALADLPEVRELAELT